MTTNEFTFAKADKLPTGLEILNFINNNGLHKAVVNDATFDIVNDYFSISFAIHD